MNQAIIRSTPPAIFSSALQSSFPPQNSRERQEESEDMEKAKDYPKEITGDGMSHSFGEGYATRSDEEGFGGIYGRNQSIPKDKDKVIHENHPAYDKNQGSVVKEKEKARHQSNASS
ncbi:hypothetical protein SLA2020_340970 [Shorea laevis]